MELLYVITLYFITTEGLFIALGKLGEIKEVETSHKTKWETARTVFMVPVVEEFIFRGIPLFLSENLFSIPFVLSAIIFAHQHKNNFSRGFLLTSPFFVVSAMALSYIAIEFGLVWAIVTHILHNALSIFQKRKKR